MCVYHNSQHDIKCPDVMNGLMDKIYTTSCRQKGILHCKLTKGGFINRAPLICSRTSGLMETGGNYIF